MTLPGERPGRRYLSVSAFPEDPQQLEALRPDGLGALVDVVLRYLDLLTVVHVAAATLRYSRLHQITKSKARSRAARFLLTTQSRCTDP